MDQPKTTGEARTEKSSSTGPSVYDQAKDFVHNHENALLIGAGAAALAGAAFIGRGKIAGLAEELFPKASELLGTKTLTETAESVKGPIRTTFPPKSLLTDASFADAAAQAFKAAEGDRPRGLAERMAMGDYSQVPFRQKPAVTEAFKQGLKELDALYPPPTTEYLQQLSTFVQSGNASTKHINLIWERHMLWTSIPDQLLPANQEKLEALTNLKRAIVANPETSQSLKEILESELKH